MSYNRSMKLQLQKKYKESETISSFIFISEDVTSWQAGQYINITMPGISPVNADRIFTIASAPHEGHLLITTIIRDSDYKQKMDSLIPGDIVEADQLGGDFVWQDNGQDKLYLAGGIGVTTFRSIILDRYHKKLLNKAALLFAGKPQQRPFVDELIAISEQDKTLRLFHFESERITLEAIQRDVPDYATRTIYLAGSQQFVESLGDSLQSAGVPRLQLKYDWFDGYISLE